MSRRAIHWAAMAIAAALAPSLSAQEAPLGHYALIEQAMEGGRLVQARSMLAHTSLAETAGDSVEFEIVSAELALAERRDAQALAAFGDLHRRGVADCRVGAGLGLALVRHRRAGEAISHLEASADACPVRWRTWNALGIALDLSGDWTGSEAAYEAAFRLSGQRAEVMNNYGFSLLLQHRFEEAARLFAAASRADPANQRYANNADIARAMAGKPLQAGKEDGRQWAHRLNNAGYAALLAGRSAEAKALFSRSIHASDSHFVRARANLSSMGGGEQ